MHQSYKRSCEKVALIWGERGQQVELEGRQRKWDGSPSYNCVFFKCAYHFLPNATLLVPRNLAHSSQSVTVLINKCDCSRGYHSSCRAPITPEGRQPSLETASTEDSHVGPRSPSFLEQLGSSDPGCKAPVSLTTTWDNSEEPCQLQSCTWDGRGLTQSCFSMGTVFLSLTRMDQAVSAVNAWHPHLHLSVLCSGKPYQRQYCRRNLHLSHIRKYT